MGVYDYAMSKLLLKQQLNDLDLQREKEKTARQAQLLGVGSSALQNLLSSGMSAAERYSDKQTALAEAGLQQDDDPLKAAMAKLGIKPADAPKAPEPKPQEPVTKPSKPLEALLPPEPFRPYTDAKSRADNPLFALANAEEAKQLVEDAEGKEPLSYKARDALAKLIDKPKDRPAMVKGSPAKSNAAGTITKPIDENPPQLAAGQPAPPKKDIVDRFLDWDRENVDFLPWSIPSTRAGEEVNDPRNNPFSAGQKRAAEIGVAKEEPEAPPVRESKGRGTATPKEIIDSLVPAAKTPVRKGVPVEFAKESQFDEPDPSTRMPVDPPTAESLMKSFLTTLDDADARYVLSKITSKNRTREEQQKLYDNRASNPYPVAPPGTSEHERGMALDLSEDFAKERPDLESKLNEFMARRRKAGNPSILPAPAYDKVHRAVDLGAVPRAKSFDAEMPEGEEPAERPQLREPVREPTTTATQEAPLKILGDVEGGGDIRTAQFRAAQAQVPNVAWARTPAEVVDDNMQKLGRQKGQFFGPSDLQLASERAKAIKAITEQRRLYEKNYFDSWKERQAAGFDLTDKNLSEADRLEGKQVTDLSARLLSDPEVIGGLNVVDPQQRLNALKGVADRIGASKYPPAVLNKAISSADGVLTARQFETRKLEVEEGKARAAALAARKQHPIGSGSISKMAEARAALGNMTDLAGLHKDYVNKFGEPGFFTGLENGINDFLRRFGKGTDERTAFVSKMADNYFAFRHATTGVASSPAEDEAIKNRLMKATDNSAIFNAILKGLYDDTARKYNAELQVNQEAGLDTGGLKTLPFWETETDKAVKHGFVPDGGQ